MVSLRKLLVTAITLVALAEASFFSMVGIKEPENKAYYRGTTPNILAFKELFQVWPYFSGQSIFWRSMVQNLQIDVWNAQSNCIIEVDVYLNLYRDLQE